ncbi:MAG TPA: LptF/LptG family permease, partial [Bacteroidales bacterium]|nr:LptF/LptG family permease [Bacteroidales bacterium]
KKLTLSFACIVFFLIGAPLGAIIRKGGLGTPAVISIFFFVVYYIISITGQKFVEEEVVGTFAGMWAASYILLPIGIFLTYKATTDSVILNIDTYLMFFKKIGDRIYRIFINGSGKNNSTD